MNEWDQHLLKVIQTCRFNNEDMWLGQLIYNVIAMHDGSRGGSYDEDFHSRLFNITDEELDIAFREWFEWVNEQKER